MISVIIPAYNHEKFVGAAIESVLHQTWNDLELIVVDDGSTDSTADVVRSYDDPRLTYYYQENQDAYNTINRGIGLAKGSFISILNSDDIYELNRLERLMDFHKKTGAQCLFTDVVPISDTGEVFSDSDFGWNVWHKTNRDFYKKCGELYAGFLHGNFMVTTSNLFMTAVAVEKVGLFCSLRYLHDYDYIFRMMLAHPGQVYYLYDEKLLYYRIHSGNTLGEAAIIGREQDQQLIKKYMLAVVSEEYRSYVETGSERMVALERELNTVKQELNDLKNIKSRTAIGKVLRLVKKRIFT